MKPARPDGLSPTVFSISRMTSSIVSLIITLDFSSPSPLTSISPGLEFSHLNTSQTCPHLFVSPASPPNSGCHHPHLDCFSLPDSLLPAPSSTKAEQGSQNANLILIPACPPYLSHHPCDNTSVVLLALGIKYKLFNMAHRMLSADFPSFTSHHDCFAPGAIFVSPVLHVS